MAAIHRQIDRWRSSELLGQLIRFGLTGGMVTALYAAIYWPLATFVIPPVAAVAVAFAITAAVGRVAHSRFSFRGHGRRDAPARTTWRFVSVQLLGFGLNMAFTWALTGPLQGPTWWPLVPAVFVTPLITFILNRVWVFG